MNGVERNSSHKWSNWFSEENPNQAVNASGFVSGLACHGKYCDNIRLEFLWSPYLRNSGDCYWTDYFSEEFRGYMGCQSNSYVSGIQCRGAYCDDIRIRCCRAR